MDVTDLIAEEHHRKILCGGLVVVVGKAGGSFSLGRTWNGHCVRDFD